MSIRPLQDRVLLRRVEKKAQTASGLYIPDTAQEKSLWCEVVATGPGRHSEDGNRFVEISVKKGDHVLLSHYSGTEVKIDGVDHVIVREEDILGVKVVE